MTSVKSQETLITFLTIENNNMNNYIVTFEYRVMVTAFAILAMFGLKTRQFRFAHSDIEFAVEVLLIPCTQ